MPKDYMARQVDFKEPHCAGWAAPDETFLSEVPPRGVTGLVLIEHSHVFEMFLSWKKTPAAVSVRNECECVSYPHGCCCSLWFSIEVGSTGQGSWGREARGQVPAGKHDQSSL